MADKWMDERDRRWRERERDSRRSDDYGRGERRFEGGEERSFAGPSDEDRGPYGGRRGRETGMGYGGRSSDDPGQYGRQGGRRRPDWQNRDYQGVSPAMQQGEYDLERRAERYQREHPPLGYERAGYQGGGRYYGDAGRDRIYREEWSQGARDTGPAPRGYDSGRDTDHDRGHFSEDYEDHLFTSGVTSGGTGGYDYERGYGDAGRRYSEGRRRDERGQRWEQRGREAGRDTGDFFRRAGERVASWFGGERDDRERDRDRDFRGMGPRGYKRNDERISDEVHERLTDDPYVDASNVLISVSAGEVTLSGTVENREAKHRAERCIEDVSGVSHVQNNLRIERSMHTRPGPVFGDSVLDHQAHGETGAGEGMSGLGGSGVGGDTTGGDTTRSGAGGSRGPSTSTSTDSGKSR